MKISDILGGTKRRKHRDTRKHRIVQKDLYTVHGSDLKEGKGRDINHLEDLVIFHGGQGGQRAIDVLRSLETSPQDTTIKWDGSPAVIFGRNEDGQFVLTDKSGFGAKGYDGRVTSPEDLESMFNARKLKDPSKKQEREEFAARMAGIWPAFEKATPENFRGYIAGDLMYTDTPSVTDGKLTFQPNTTLYSVNPNSDIGKRIASSSVGVVVHVQIDHDGNKSKPDTGDFQAGELLILPPVTVTTSPNIDNQHLDQLEQKLKSNSSSIDSLLNVPAELKMKNFDNILYTYVNSAVKTGSLDKLGRQDFVNWLSQSKLSAGQQQRAAEWAEQNDSGFDSMFDFILAVKQVKNEVIAQLDNQPADIEASTAGQKGGEGYVVGSDVKLVNRAGFTAANAARDR